MLFLRLPIKPPDTPCVRRGVPRKIDGIRAVRVPMPEMPRGTPLREGFQGDAGQAQIRGPSAFLQAPFKKGVHGGVREGLPIGSGINRREGHGILKYIMKHLDTNRNMT